MMTTYCRGQGAHLIYHHSPVLHHIAIVLEYTAHCDM